MALGIVSLAATVPLVASSTLSLQKDAQSSRTESSAERWKTEKSHLHVRASKRSPSAHKAIFPSSSSNPTYPATAQAEPSTPHPRKLPPARVVLHEGKLYIHTAPEQQRLRQQPRSASLHPFTGYFLAFPDRSFDGLASTISIEPPLLNWIYLDLASQRLSYGTRSAADEGLPGPFDLLVQQLGVGTRSSDILERRLSFDGWEGSGS